MLKTELEAAYEKLKKKHEDFVAKVDKALKQQLDSCCSEAITPIEEFCDTVGIPFPTAEVTIKIPYGRGIGNITDEDCDDMYFETISTTNAN